MILIKQLSKYFLYFLAITFTGRLGLFILYYERIENSDINIYLTFLYGAKIDIMGITLLFAIPLILLCFVPKIFANFVDKFLKYYFLFFLVAFIYVEIATFPFVAQYDVRPNFLFVEYLQYPKEVFSMIFAQYQKELVFAFVVLLTFIYKYLKNYNLDFKKSV